MEYLFEFLDVEEFALDEMQLEDLEEGVAVLGSEVQSELKALGCVAELSHFGVNAAAFAPEFS